MIRKVMSKKIIVSLLILFISACSTVTAPPGERKAPLQGDSLLVEQYRIGVDDILEINVWKNAELSVTVPVRPDGRISMPLLGDVMVGGLTPSEVSRRIRNDLARYLRDPHVVVILKELKSHAFLSRVRVTGAVNQPVTLPFRQGMTVLDAVLEAGGLSEFAAANRAVLYRRLNGETKRLPIYLEEILEEGDLSTNYTVIPGDVIAIPERIL